MTRPIIVFIGVISVITAATAADFTLTGKLNGRLYYDMDDGDVDAGGTITGDADPLYMVRYRADVFLLSDLGNDCYGNLGITFNDSSLGPAYNYALELNPIGNYYSGSPVISRNIYAKLYEVNFTKLNAVAGLDITAGGFKMRYGDGGYYNDLMNGIEPHSFVAELDPYGIRARRVIGPVQSEFAFGVDGNGAVIAGTTQNVGPVTFYIVSESRAYDVKGLWDIQFLSAMSDYWMLAFVNSGNYTNPATFVAGNDISMTQHIGADAELEFEKLSVYPLFAFHRFADSPDISETVPTGGMLVQVYSEVAASLTNELTIRGAVLYEYWKANEVDAWYNDSDNNADLLLWVEPQLNLFEDLTVAGNFRYKNPNMKPWADTLETFYHDDITNSISYGPHVIWRPVEGAALDLTYTHAQWDPSYDLYGNDEIDTSVEDKIKMEIEVAF